MSAHSLDRNADRLLQLSNEVSRIAGTLARLSTDPDIGDRFIPRTMIEVSAEQVRSVILARRARSTFLDGDLFADPAWDILLDLFYSELTQRRVAVSSACTAAAVPATTALRWLSNLVERGIIVRHADPLDGRRVFVELASGTSSALRNYFSAFAPAEGI